MIVGIAGHIDHGKTTLVRALTGVDTDRLPEEKRRGISIELGYAYLATPEGGRIGFIDVPGHERLLHTMLAGATGIDFALLLVAADDGVMPQTREHLAVLSLLGLRRGAVVLSKCDRASPERRAALRAEIASLLAGTGLDAAPVLEVAATQGEGLDALRALLFAAAGKGGPARDERLGFRLAVDRAFSLDGVGTVATGTAHAGQVRLGDTLALVPDARARHGRVRSLHAQNAAATSARAGQRCALGLAGLDRQELARGQWLVDPALALSTGRIDVLLRLWPAEARALRSGTPVHVHLGAQALTGTVAILDAEQLEPGARALVQLVLREPAAAWHGERVVLRDASASRTLAGGVVLDPFAPARYRRSVERLAELAALRRPDVEERLQGLLAVAAQGLDLGGFARAQGLTPQGADALTQGLAPGDVLLAHSAQTGWALARGFADALGERALQALEAYHQRCPDELGPDAARLRRLVAPRLPEPLWAAMLAGLRERGRLAQRGAFIHLPAHGAQLSATEQRIAQKVAPRLAQAGFEGAWARDLARDCGESEALVRTALARLAQRGELHQVVKDLFYDAGQIVRLAAIARELAGVGPGEVQAAAFRDATGLGRKRAIQVLEHFDRIGLLRRVGDTHKLRADARLFLDEPSGGVAA